MQEATKTVRINPSTNNPNRRVEKNEIVDGRKNRKDR